MKKIGIDLDNTVADYLAGVLPKMKELLGLEPTHQNTACPIEAAFSYQTDRSGQPRSKWEIMGFRPQDKDKIAEIRRLLYVEHRLLRNLPKIEEDVHLLSHELRDLGYEVNFITARNEIPEIVEDSVHWLETNGFHYDGVFFTEEKAKLCKEKGITVLIDDDPRMILSSQQVGIKIIMRDQPWNKVITEGIARRIFTWREIIPIVKEFEN